MIENFVLSCKGIARHFNEASGVLKVLTDVNLQISLGEKIAIIGSSGSGKTTLLHILGGLDQPTYGEIFLNGELFSNILLNISNDSFKFNLLLKNTSILYSSFNSLE